MTSSLPMSATNDLSWSRLRDPLARFLAQRILAGPDQAAATTIISRPARERTFSPEVHRAATETALTQGQG